MHSVRNFRAGYFQLTCARQPELVFYTAGEPRRCPVCREMRPKHNDAAPAGVDRGYSGESTGIVTLAE